MSEPRRTLLAGLPVTEHRLYLAGACTNVLAGGEGPPLLLLHGGVEAGGAYWAPLIPELVRSHRVIVPDLPGLGESEPFPEPWFDQARFNDWFRLLIEQACGVPPVVIAHSLLGGPATAFAARHDVLESLAVYGAPAVGPYRMPLGLAFAAILFDLRPSRGSQERFLRWVFLDPQAAQQQHRAWFAAFNAYCVERGRLPSVKQTMRQLIRVGTERPPAGELERIRIPVSLLWGRHDRMAPLRMAEAAAQTFGWPLHVIEDAGHAPHLEQPDAFLEALRLALPHFRPASAGAL